MELKLNKRYLIDKLQHSENGLCFNDLRVIKCIEISKKAYKLEHDNGSASWYMKNWKINIVDELSEKPLTPNQHVDVEFLIEKADREISNIKEKLIEYSDDNDQVFAYNERLRLFTDIKTWLYNSQDISSNITTFNVKYDDPIFIDTKNLDLFDKNEKK